MDAGDSRVRDAPSKRSAIVRLVLLLLFVALVGTVGYFLAPSDIDAVRDLSLIHI